MYFEISQLSWQERKAAKSGELLFVEAMGELDSNEMKESFERFEKAAMKGHEESQWIWNVVKDRELTDENTEAIEKAFAETDSPLGYYFAGELCDWGSGEQFEYMKKSSDGGCSWGQVEFAEYFNPDDLREFVEKDHKMYLELLGKAVAQNNPRAIWRRGLHKEKGNIEEARRDYRLAAELGWQDARLYLSQMFYRGRVVEKDLVQAVYWGSETDSHWFWVALMGAAKAWNDQAFDDLDCDFNRLAMELGKGLYWYKFGTEEWDKRDEAAREFGVKCLDYYCETLELQQAAILLFLLFWNKTTGVKGPGRMIGQIVWEGRYDCLVKKCGE